jgi:hypothetical protein
LLFMRDIGFPFHLSTFLFGYLISPFLHPSIPCLMVHNVDGKGWCVPTSKFLDPLWISLVLHIIQILWGCIILTIIQYLSL